MTSLEGVGVFFRFLTTLGVYRMGQNNLTPLSHSIRLSHFNRFSKLTITKAFQLCFAEKSAQSDFLIVDCKEKMFFQNLDRA